MPLTAICFCSVVCVHIMCLCIQFWPHYIQLAIRTVLAAFSLAVLIISGQCQGDNTWFIYLTNWTFLSITLANLGFFLLSAVHLVRELLWRERSQEQKEVACMAWSWYHSVQQIIFTFAITGSIMVTILLWALLGGPADFLTITMHGVCIALVLPDLLASNFKVNVLHGVYTTAISLCYVIFTAIYTHITKKAIYPVLDWSKDPGASAALAVPTGLLAPFAIHLVAYALFKLRTTVAKRVSWLRRRDGTATYHVFQQEV